MYFYFISDAITELCENRTRKAERCRIKTKYVAALLFSSVRTVDLSGHVLC